MNAHLPSKWQWDQAIRWGIDIGRFQYPEANGRVRWDFPTLAMKRTGEHKGVLCGDRITVTIRSTGAKGGAAYRVRVTFRGRTLKSHGNRGGVRRGIEVARELIHEVKLGIG